MPEERKEGKGKLGRPDIAEKHEARELAPAGFGDESDRFTSFPELWKAHGTAGWCMATVLTEPRTAGLFQTVNTVAMHHPKAVLEQPSSRRTVRHSLG